MAALRSRNAVLLFEIEAVEGVAETPAEATDAVLVENPRLRPVQQATQTDEVTGSLDPRAPIVGGTQMELSFDVYLKGSGAAATAPEFGDMLRACGWAQTITAAAVPGAPEACAAGGSTTTAVLGASAAGTAQLYRGMPIDFTGNQVGPSFISDYTAGKVATLTDIFAGAIVATTNYQIPVNVRYGPASAAIPSATIELFRDGVKWKLAGARGSFSLAMPAAGAAKFSFRFTGMFVSKTDVAVPTAVYDATRPPVWKGGKMNITRVDAALSAFSLGDNNQLVYPPNPNAAEGFDPTVITRRRLGGQMNPLMTLVATRDLFARMRDGTPQILHARWGSTAGNRVGVTLPAAKLTAVEEGDQEGLATEQAQFFADGADAGAFITLY